MNNTNKKLVFGITGPSAFSSEIQDMTEEFFDATPFYINQNKKDDLLWALNKVDAIILAGGSDICPTSYNQDVPSGQNLTKFDVKRDRRELFAIDFAFQNNIPILGICRGHQMLGVYHGLHLIQDISDSEICHNPKADGINMNQFPCHFLHIVPKFKTELGERILCNSFHHQAIHFSKQHLENYPSRGVEVMGYSYLDFDDKKGRKIIELMKGVDRKWISCQFHPEDDYRYTTASREVLSMFKAILHERYSPNAG